MKTLYLLLLLPLSLFSYAQQLPVTACETSDEKINLSYSRAAGLQNSMEELVKLGVPGSAMAVYSNEGWWTSAAGFAKIEDKTPMQVCHLQYLQSISKTYMAVAVLKLIEQGKMELNQPIANYLPEKINKYISTPEKITVEMLLNHTSGIPEYNSEPAYISYLLQHPDHYFAPEDYLKYIDRKPLTFAPGTKYSYRNTNYLLLALMADAITGDHAQFIREVIFKPLGLTNTFYRGDKGYLSYPTLVNSYWDRHADGIIENASLLQRNNVQSLVGDDGIVATPMDAVKFLKGLMEGKLISSDMLERMKSWAKDSKGNPTYGLGLDHATFIGHIGYGHSGGGIGAGCQLYYFPEKDVYIFTAINLGTVTESPLHVAAEKTIEKIYSVLLD
jgi:D-alanyl-D-alanine carboxypeptidase